MARCGPSDLAGRHWLEVLMRKGQPATEGGEVATEDFGEGTELFEGGIFLAALHATDIAGIGVGFEREILLG